MAKDDVKVSIDGIDEAMKILESLNTKTQVKIMYSALNRSLTPMISAGRRKYKSRQHPYSGSSKRMKSKYGVNRGATSLQKVKLKRGVIGVRAKPSNKKGGQLVHLLDLGTKNRKTKSGAGRGRLRKWGYWSGTIRQEGPKAIRSASSFIIKALESKMNSSIRKYGVKI